MVVITGGNYDAWDLELRGGLFGSARLLMATEEHGGGRQMMRFRLWPKWSRFALLPVFVLAGIATASAADGAWLASALTAVPALLIVLRALLETGGAVAALSGALRKLGAS
jgi:hypothetical protein